MRVLHVAPQYIPAWRYGGPIRSVHGLCKGLADLGHEVHVYTTNIDGPSDSDVPLEQAVEIDGVQVWYYPVPRFRRLFYAPKMKPMLRERIPGFDIVHIQSIWLWPMWAAARIAHAAGVPYVMTPRGMLERRLIRGRSRLVKTLWLSLVEKKSFRHAAAVHATSRRELEEFAHFDFGAPAPFLVPNGLDPPPSATATAIDHGETPRIVFLGRVAWEKGLDRIVPAMRHIPNARLSIHGPDWWSYGETVSRLAREAGVADRVEMHGATEDAAKWDVLRSATVVVLPSYSENFGVAALEAMAVGRPVVVTPEVGLADVVSSSGAGLVVEGDPGRMGEAIRQLLDDPARMDEMGRRGRRVVAEQFTWNRIAEAMDREYGRILGSSAPR